mmetsp:Transcript_86689/g.163414  ORF Transcript_86689/g.163414 Transcript_86689/m.163414 type:complete len:311 (-) Transcript_86689:127-1059(-)
MVPQVLPEESDMSTITIKNTFINVLVKSEEPPSKPRSSSLPPYMRLSEVFDCYDKRKIDGHQDSDVATDVGTEDVIASDLSYTGAESETDAGSASTSSQVAPSPKASQTPLSAKARPYQPQAAQAWTPVLQCMPAQNLVQAYHSHALQFDPLLLEFLRDAGQIVSDATKLLEIKSAVERVDVFNLTQGGYDIYVHLNEPTLAQKLLSETVRSILRGAELSLCTYILGYKRRPLCSSTGPFQVTASGLGFTADFVPMYDRTQACRSMYDNGFCTGCCERLHPSIKLPVSVTMVTDEGTAGNALDSMVQESV